MKLKQTVIALGLALLSTLGANAERQFVHPGISYTQGQLDRMKAMVEAKVEPYYTTFQNLVNSEHTQLDRRVYDRGTQIREGSFNGTIGIDGRCAHDCALIWKLTGDTRYADKAVEYLNANNHYTNTSARGTGPLDNGKINLLIEAAELMRDYEGWEPEEQQKFKDMLTYPYYSNTEDVAAKFANWSNDDENGITFYWNILNGDCGRHGNQGMFGMLGMLAMGIYLDNELIYDRALRYVQGLPHRSDDLAYPSGPPSVSANPTKQSEHMKEYTRYGAKNEIEDYGYDELLQYYFYPNGQCQESSRDQGHVMAGVHKFIEFAEIAWNQGDDLYSLHDKRLLKGIEFNVRYNLSFFKSYDDQPGPWEPSGYTSNLDEATLDNNMYLQVRSRSGRWESILPSPAQRGAISNVGSRECAFSHYRYRLGEDDKDMLWLSRARDYVMDQYGYETSGTGPNWYYEWNGWGTLTKTLDTWMAGDPVSFADGKRVSGIHILPGEFSAADYDYFNDVIDAEGRTYHKVNAAAASAYRPDGGVALREDNGRWVVVDNHDGEWISYTVSVPVTGNYDVFVTAKSSGKGKIGVAVAGGEPKYFDLSASDDYIEMNVAALEFAAGASVIRIFIEGEDEALAIDKIRVAYNPLEESKLEFSGYLDSRAKDFVADWKFSGMIVSDIDLIRSATGDVKDAEVVSENNTFGHFVDSSIEGTVPSYTYWIRYKNNGEELLSDPVSFEWGEFLDMFSDAEVSQWNIPANNGSGEFVAGGFRVTPTEKGAARLSRTWSFPFHAGNFPILACEVTRPEGMVMSLYSGANSWMNGSDTFTGKIGDNIYYYDLTKGAFQNTKGEDKVTVSVDEITPLPLQLRFQGPASEPFIIRWIGTFKDVEAIKTALNDPSSPLGVESVDMVEICGNGCFYNLMGVDCGSDAARLLPGIYIRDGKKILIK